MGTDEGEGEWARFLFFFGGRNGADGVSELWRVSCRRFNRSAFTSDRVSGAEEFEVVSASDSEEGNRSALDTSLIS